jgi:hypothetical protein
MSIQSFVDVSIDLETLDTSPRAVITSIALQCFNRQTGEMGPGFHCHVGIVRQLMTRNISWSTLKWWWKQDREAQMVLLRGQRSPHSIREAGRAMTTFLMENTTAPEVRMWGNGATFDNAILVDFFANTIHKQIPWHFYMDRDLRTRLDDYEIMTGRDLKHTETFVGIKHCAQADALHQAKLIIKSNPTHDES